MLQNTMPGPQVLIIGGNESLGRSLSEQVDGAQCEVVAVADVGLGIGHLETGQYDLVLVAASLPDQDPVEVCRRIRQAAQGEPPPILLAPSARVGSGVGDSTGKTPEDYVAADVASLAKGIAATLRDMRTSRVANRLRHQGIEIDRNLHLVLVDGKQTKLTPTEFRILWVLLSEPGRVFSRSRLTELCIGENAPVSERTIDVHIKSIRQKLCDRADMVKTVRGVGYRFGDAMMGRTNNAVANGRADIG